MRTFWTPLPSIILTALIIILSINRFKMVSFNLVIDAYSRISPMNRSTSLPAMLAIRNSSVIACIRALLSVCSGFSVPVMRRNRCSARQGDGSFVSLIWTRAGRSSFSPCQWFFSYSSTRNRSKIVSLSSYSLGP